jgi:Serine endopeptidase inhibitors
LISADPGFSRALQKLERFELCEVSLLKTLTQQKESLMSKKKSAAPAASTPFFARYLEGQVASGQARAEVRSGRGSAYAKAKAKAPAKGPTMVTLKFPSDNDELNYVPHYRSPKDVPEKYREPIMTLKFPSDSDEHSYQATYLAKADVPKGKATKTGGKIQLKKK